MVSGFGFRVSGFGFRGSGFWFLVSGFGDLPPALIFPLPETSGDSSDQRCLNGPVSVSASKRRGNNFEKKKNPESQGQNLALTVLYVPS